MEGWRGGGMEGWRDGGMEGWKHGGRVSTGEGREVGEEEVGRKRREGKVQYYIQTVHSRSMLV